MVSASVFLRLWVLSSSSGSSSQVVQKKEHGAPWRHVQGSKYDQIDVKAPDALESIEFDFDFDHHHGRVPLCGGQRTLANMQQSAL